MTLPVSPKAVLVVAASPEPSGPKIDVLVDEEWWAGATKDHRKALFMAALQGLGATGMRVIPEELGAESSRALDPVPEPPIERAELWTALDSLIAHWQQVRDTPGTSRGLAQKARDYVDAYQTLRGNLLGEAPP